MITTLNKIKLQKPCTENWQKLLRHLGKKRADEKELKITTVLEGNGLDFALWCLRAVEGKDREIKLYAVWCARKVQHLVTDKRSIDALEVVEKFYKGLSTNEELYSAEIEAINAARCAFDLAIAVSDVEWVVGDFEWNARAKIDAEWAAKAIVMADAMAAAWATRAFCTAAWDTEKTALAAAWALNGAARGVRVANEAARLAQTKKLIEICGEA